MLLSAILLTAALSPQAPPPPAPVEAVPAAVSPAAAETPAAASSPAAPKPALGSAASSIDAGLVAYRKRRLAAAAAEFRKAVDADPSSAAAHYYLGYALYKQAEPRGRHAAGKKEAAEEFSKAFSLDPTFRPTWGVAKK